MKIKHNQIEKIKQRLITVTPLDLAIENRTKNTIHFECIEVLDGVKPKLLVVIKKIKKCCRKEA